MVLGLRVPGLLNDFILTCDIVIREQKKTKALRRTWLCARNYFMGVTKKLYLVFKNTT